MTSAQLWCGGGEREGARLGGSDGDMVDVPHTVMGRGLGSWGGGRIQSGVDGTHKVGMI